MGNADKSGFLYYGNQLILKKSVEYVFTERICLIRVLLLYLLLNKKIRTFYSISHELHEFYKKIN
jgi:hypothetical protein